MTIPRSKTKTIPYFLVKTRDTDRLDFANMLKIYWNLGATNINHDKLLVIYTKLYTIFAYILYKNDVTLINKQW